MTDAPLLLDSITDAGSAAAGRVVVCGSHGGMLPAALASVARVRAVVLNDAGGGAGAEGVRALRLPAAVAAAMSCRIGDAADTLARGRISVANAAARALGVREGQAVAEAAGLLAAAEMTDGGVAPVAEARRVVRLPGVGPEVALVDSASLVKPEDAARIVIAGSHGGLIGGDPGRALKAKAVAAAFNDAGGGAGTTRLPALQARGVPAVMVAHDSARIGDAVSMLEGGVISHANALAEASGARAGMKLADWLLAFPDEAGSR